MPVNCAPREGCALRHRGVAQSGSAPALGAGCRGFESLHPDHFSSAMPQVEGWYLKQVCSARMLLDGGCSSPGRAPDCGSGGSGFETRQPPHFPFSFFGVPSQCRGESVSSALGEGAAGFAAQIKERGQSVPPNLAFQAWVVRPSLATCNALAFLAWGPVCRKLR